MTEYRRAHVPGATWVFTVNLDEWKGNGLLLDRIDALRCAFQYVREKHPFRWEAVVILPDHRVITESGVWDGLKEGGVPC